MLALPLAYLAVRRQSTYPVLLAVTNVVYAVPALTLFVLLSPWLGYLSDKPIVIAMALYTLVILVRNMVEGIRAVPESVIRAADGMGYRPFKRFGAVEFPLALPGIIAGLRLATVATVSLISVGAVIGRGALGRMFADGYQRKITVELWSAMIATMALALFLDLVIYVVGRAITPWTRVPRSRGRDGMGTIIDGIGWLLTPDNWTGNNGIGRAVVQHIWYSVLATVVAIVIALPIGLAIGHTGRGRFVAVNVTGLWRAIPTIGVVTLVFRWQPLSIWPVLVALVILAIPPIVLNTVAGIDSVPADVKDAATGMGLTGWQALWRVEVPNALPLILAGIRSAANQVIATVSVAGFVGLGTLGVFIFTASRTSQRRRHGRRVDRHHHARAAVRGDVRAAPAGARVARRAGPDAAPPAAFGHRPRRPRSGT